MSTTSEEERTEQERTEQEREALKYDLEALRDHIKKRLVNITIFEKAISEEREGIVRDQHMIDFLESRRDGTN